MEIPKKGELYIALTKDFSEISRVKRSAFVEDFPDDNEFVMLPFMESDFSDSALEIAAGQFPKPMPLKHVLFQKKIIKIEVWEVVGVD